MTYTMSFVLIFRDVPQILFSLVSTLDSQFKSLSLSEPKFAACQISVWSMFCKIPFSSFFVLIFENRIKRKKSRKEQLVAHLSGVPGLPF